MEIKILFNSSSEDEELSVGWGLSFLIDKRIMFDTGEKGDLLNNNINKLKVDLSLIEAAVISHDHWDHTGGLWEILKQRPNIKVYGCPGFNLEFKHKVSEFPSKLIDADNFTLIAPRIYSTGEIIGTYKGKNISEQTLIIKTDKGFSLITGCAHPGIIKILERAKTQLSINKFYAVLGGFHLKDHSAKDIEKIVKRFAELKVKRVGATHCSGTVAENIFKEKFRDNFLDMKVGQVVTV